MQMAYDTGNAQWGWSSACIDETRDMFSGLCVPREEQRIRLEELWDGAFYRDIFARINEGALADLHADERSCRNALINMLVGADQLKSAFDQSEEGMYHLSC